MTFKCPNCEGELRPSMRQDMWASECGWGVTGLEVFVNSHKNLRQMIADKAVGRMYRAEPIPEPVR